MDNLLGLLFKAASVEPRYERDLCLAIGHRTACSACRDVCPHQAITIRSGIEIDPVDCSGCGLCVQACPSQALAPRGRPPTGPVNTIKCSQVAGDAATVRCLATLRASELLAATGSGGALTVAHGNCSECEIGSQAVLLALEKVQERALELARLRGREISLEVARLERLDEKPNSDPLSRRELLRQGWRSLQQGAGEALAPLDTGPDEPGLPSESQRQYRIIAASKPEAGELVPWRLPRVADSCILCPACTQACPTGAIDRVFEDGEGILKLDPQRCIGCDACVGACPVVAVTMDDQVTWGELASASLTAYRADPGQGKAETIAR